jgi:hypothetical protein
MLGVGNSLWELFGIALIVLVPTLPVTYFLWGAVDARRRQRGHEIESGRSTATPFAVISIVGTVVLVAAVLTMLLVISLRALAT